MTLSTNQDFLDVIDLDSALGSGYPEKLEQSANGPGTGRYNISLESITDDELQYVTRSLITPVSFQTYGDDRLWSYSRTPSQRSRPLPRNDQVPTFRSESAAIFNRLPDDELSVDFAARDLSDFMDPLLLEQVISRPGSRVPRNHSSNVNDGASIQSPTANPLRPHRTEGSSKDKERDTVASTTIRTDFERNQHAKLTPKRHSLHGDILMALRRDSDALLQRRESLLKLRKFSEGHHANPEPQYQSDHRQYQSDIPETQYKDTRLQPHDINPVDIFRLKRDNQVIDITSKVVLKNNHTSPNEHGRSRIIREPRPERRSLPVHQGTPSRITNASQIPEALSDRNKSPPASVTESAKTLLARVRQHRVEDRPEINDRRRQNTETLKSPDQTRRYLSLDEYTPGHRSSRFSVERNNELKGGSSRRWSSSLPLSNTQYSPIRQDKLVFTPRKKSISLTGHYTAKKSALDRSTDRYVALLGKPPSSK